MAAGLSPQLALRIGLAARALPAVAPGRLVSVLLDLLRHPLTDQKLKGLTVHQLRDQPGFEQIPVPQIKTALAYLWDRAGVDILDPAVPAPEVLREGDMPRSVRIALASDHGELMDGQFGRCLRFLVYQVAADQARLVDVRGTAAAKAAFDGNAWRVERLRDCQLVYVAGIGLPSMAGLMKAGIYPVKSPARSAGEILKEIRTVLREAPPPWLGKAMGLDELARWRFPRPMPLD